MNLSGVNLFGANLQHAAMVNTIVGGADLTGCRIYGISAWNLKLEATKQHSLIITRPDEPTVTVDNIEVAQFVYLLLHNEKIRDVIDTITSKAVLILGRFTQTEGLSVQSISWLTHTALASAVYASRETLPLPCKTCFRLAGCAFSGRVSNPLDHYRRFLATFPSSFSGLCLTLAG